MDKTCRLDSFERITLDEMEDIRLMRRIDTKYILRSETLPHLLEILTTDYFIQQDALSGKRSFEYFTLYYDTHDYAMYHSHQNGKLNRFKIRTREYCDSRCCFLEIKYKSNKGITRKIRIDNNGSHSIDSAASRTFIDTRSPYCSSLLEPKLESCYRRVTLVNKDKTERLTIDNDLEFQNIHTGKTVQLPRLTIIEIKKERCHPSLIEQKMKQLHITPYKISKYCLGTALTDPEIKHNAIKRKAIYIHKITDFIYG
ncbi:polyphosphate polymerase domain-containing protein [uncultured Proteiniphilum sp.]|uniref:polyphosphate polymerase domain-containing protein n=1 Tax=uncultured Proteiniphilum sp. TaxID=497637 RepID=UPI0026030C0E|nr:polyphosphate polymerase domain-containing protein [uncultured Proteiniphilum sp.]